MVELLALLGDSSDNIPGVDGIGKKTAAKLLNEYKSIDEILRNIDNIKNSRVRNGLSQGKETLDLSLQLVSIDKKVDIPISFKALAYWPSN